LKRLIFKKITMDYSYIKIEVKNKICYLTINRPENLNSLASVAVRRLEKLTSINKKVN